MKKKMDHLKDFLEKGALAQSPLYSSHKEIFQKNSKDAENTLSSPECPLKEKKPHPSPCFSCNTPFELNDSWKLKDSKEIKNMIQRLWVASIFSISLIILSLKIQYVSSIWISQTSLNWIQLFLSTPVITWCVWPIFKQTWNSLRKKSLDMFVPLTSGIGLTYIYSLFILLFQMIFPNWIKSEFSLHPYFEVATTLAFFMILSEIFRLKICLQADQKFQNLLPSSSHIVHRVHSNGQEEEILLKNTHPGDILRISPGDKIPVDGTILEGIGVIQSFKILGEFFQIQKSLGDYVFAGTTLTGTETLLIRTRHVGSETHIAQVLDLIFKSKKTQAPSQALANTISTYIIFASFFMSLLSAALWMTWGLSIKIDHAILSSTAVLAIACPFLGLIISLISKLNIQESALEGIFFKNAKTLEFFQKADTLVLDKTGILTSGKPHLVNVIPLTNTFSRTQLLSFSASLEKESEHPISQAILESAYLEDVPLYPNKNFDHIPGMGVRGIVQKKEIALGGKELMHFLEVDMGELQDKVFLAREKGHTVLFLAINGILEGFLSLVDPLKPYAKETIKALQKDGLSVILLTGDNPITARAIAQEVGISAVHAEVLPEQKYDFIVHLQNQGKIVAMVGTPLHDGAALEQSDIGISTGEIHLLDKSSDIFLLSKDLKDLLKARLFSKKYMKTIRQNFFFVLLYNACALPVAAGILYPNFGVLLSPISTSAFMILISALTLWNASRPRKVSP